MRSVQYRGTRPGSFRATVREDRRRHGGSWGHRGFHAVFVHRAGRWLVSLPMALRLPLGVVQRMLEANVRMLHRIELPVEVKLGREVRLDAAGAISVAPGTTIGNGCSLDTGVTIGWPIPGQDATALGAILEPEVQLGAHVAVAAGVRIAQGARVTAGTVLNDDVPDGHDAHAPAARTLRPLKART